MATLLPDTAWVELNRLGGADIMAEDMDWLKEVEVLSTVTCGWVEPLLGGAAAFFGAGVFVTLGKLLAAGPSGLARVAST